jgi:hypothetical protein
MEEKLKKEIDLEIKKSIENIEKSTAELKQYQFEGVKNILKHFDRIHDKLFNFNNILIVGYFTLSKIYNSISIFNILIPICNLLILIYVEYRMMEKSRFDATIFTIPMDNLKDYRKRNNITNLFSLFSIITTLLVTSMFLYYLFTS